MTDIATATIGDNRPPAVDPLQGRLAEEHADLFKRRDELIALADLMPAVVEDDETDERFNVIIKDLRSLWKNAEAERVGEKEFFLEGGRQVDGLFKQILDPAKEAGRKLNARVTDYKKKKEAEERRARLEQERLAREEADRLAREAAEKAAAVETEAELDVAVAAEQTAVQADLVALKAKRAATAKPADLSRTRSASGVVSSLHTWWDIKDLDRDTIELEPLRHHLPADALEKAARAFVRAGGRKLAGVTIFENSENRTR